MKLMQLEDEDSVKEHELTEKNADETIESDDHVNQNYPSQNDYCNQ